MTTEAPALFDGRAGSFFDPPISGPAWPPTPRQAHSQRQGGPVLWFARAEDKLARGPRVVMPSTVGSRYVRFERETHWMTGVGVDRDIELIAAIVRGEEKARSAFLTWHEDTFLRICRTVTPNGLAANWVLGLTGISVGPPSCVPIFSRWEVKHQSSRNELAGSRGSLEAHKPLTMDQQRALFTDTKLRAEYNRMIQVDRLAPALRSTTSVAGNRSLSMPAPAAASIDKTENDRTFEGRTIHIGAAGREDQFLVRIAFDDGRADFDLLELQGGEGTLPRCTLRPRDRTYR
jgi:hypothetical protein